MNFFERPPSKQWAILKYRETIIAEVWFKPDRAPFALKFRIPRDSFQIPEIAQRLIPENLLKAIGIAAAEVESWHHDAGSDSEGDGFNPELSRSLVPPSQGVDYLNLYIRLHPPRPVAEPSEEANIPETSEAVSRPAAVEGQETNEEEKEPETSAPASGPDTIEEQKGQQITEEKWQYLEGRWNAILAIETSVDSLRMSMESLRAEMEGAISRPLGLEDKVNALSADLAQWNSTKNRLRYALPKLKEFIHRSTWANGIPERKVVEEHFKNHVQPRIPFPDLEQVIAQFDNLLKNRQVLSAQGVTVYQECRSILGESQGALRTLQRNASNAAKKKGSAGKRGKSF